MQTFLPYSSFERSAKVLDRARLGKQRVETKQILNANFGLSKGWINHPAVKMWKGYEQALALYGLAVCGEWIRRGYKDTLTEQFSVLASELPDTGDPNWLDDHHFHASHRSNLLRKDPVWYSQFGWAEPDNMEYCWPV